MPFGAYEACAAGTDEKRFAGVSITTVRAAQRTRRRQRNEIKTIKNNTTVIAEAAL